MFTDMDFSKKVDVTRHWRCRECQHERTEVVQFTAMDWLLLCHSDPSSRRVAYVGGFFERHWYEDCLCANCLQQLTEVSDVPQDLLQPPVPQLEPKSVRLRRSLARLFNRFFH